MSKNLSKVTEQASGRTGFKPRQLGSQMKSLNLLQGPLQKVQRRKKILPFL